MLSEVPSASRVHVGKLHADIRLTVLCSCAGVSGSSPERHACHKALLHVEEYRRHLSHVIAGSKEFPLEFRHPRISDY